MGLKTLINQNRHFHITIHSSFSMRPDMARHVLQRNMALLSMVDEFQSSMCTLQDSVCQTELVEVRLSQGNIDLVSASFPSLPVSCHLWAVLSNGLPGYIHVIYAPLLKLQLVAAFLVLEVICCWQLCSYRLCST